MVDDDDLDAAVTEGIVSQQQADALRIFAANRRPQQAAARPHEERFRFMRGFNDFFFTVGVALVGAALIHFSTQNPIGNLIYFSTQNPIGNLTAAAVIAAAVIWMLAELLVRRMRLVLPGILLTCFFVYFVFQAVDAGWNQFVGSPPRLIRTTLKELFLQNSTPGALLAKLGAVAATASLFYWRFRLPFALLPIAGSLVAAAMITAAAVAQRPDAAFVVAAVYLLCGLLVFAAAMAYDMSDPDRVTRRADCAFWLHLLAAPIIVHSLIGMVSPVSLYNWVPLTAQVAWSVVAIVAALTVVALIVDRRALFVSALSYLGIVIGYAITGAGSGDSANIFFATLLILGVMVLVLGIGWQPLRNVVMHALPGALARHLPPAAIRA
jgi:hypothetical protein